MTEQTPISVRFMNELGDHIQAQRVLYAQGVFAKLDKVVAVLMIGIGIYAIAFAGLQWWTVLWIPLGVAEWFDLFNVSRWRTRIQFQRNPKFREEYHLTFSPENIHFKTDSLDATVQWTHYERVVESPDLFLLTYGKGLYSLIPKRCFGSAGEMDEFRELVGKMIPG